MFGEDTSMAMKLIVTLIIVLALIGFVVLILKRFGVGRLGAMSSSGRQPRLAVMDMAHLDSRRKLVIVRRDMVEHLIMIGGPNDVVIETGIVRGQALPQLSEASNLKTNNQDTRIAPTFTSSINQAAGAPKPAPPQSAAGKVPEGNAAPKPVEPPAR